LKINLLIFVGIQYNNKQFTHFTERCILV